MKIGNIKKCWDANSRTEPNLHLTSMGFRKSNENKITTRELRYIVKIIFHRIYMMIMTMKNIK